MIGLVCVSVCCAFLGPMISAALGGLNSTALPYHSIQTSGLSAFLRSITCTYQSGNFRSPLFSLRFVNLLVVCFLCVMFFRFFRVCSSTCVHILGRLGSGDLWLPLPLAAWLSRIPRLGGGLQGRCVWNDVPEAVFPFIAVLSNDFLVITV